MPSYEYQSEFAREWYEQGRRRGLEQGRTQGLQLAVYTLARAQRVALTADDEAAIEVLRDPRGLTALIQALGEARTTGEARAALERALGRSPPVE